MGNDEDVMIGLVLVAHGQLAHEFHAALEHVVGPQEQIVSVAIGPDDDMEARRVDIVAAIETVDSGSGVIVATDMFGGTPSNLAISVMDDQDIEVVAGINLPLLIKLAKLRIDQPISATVRDAAEAGRKYIKVARDLLDDK